MFFVFDGVDGAGKSTQISLFVTWLESLGHSVISCKDPGSTSLGDALRKLLLDRHQVPISMKAEMLMFTAARAQLVDELIRPAIAAGKMVVLDRYIFSTVVYQGYAGNLDPNEIWTVNRIATGGLMPDVTFIFDLSPKEAFQRLQRRVRDVLDRMESRGMEYFERVRDGFLKEAERWPDRVDVIEANRPIEKIQADLQRLSTDYIRRKKFDRI